MLVDPVNDTFNGANVFGPYNVSFINHLDPSCQSFFTTEVTCGHIEITFHNLSRWNWNPDYHFDGDGVVPIDYGSGPSYTNVFVGLGTSRVIFDHTFAEDYNGGTVNVSYQSILGPVTQLRVASQTLAVNTNCVPEPDPALAATGVSPEQMMFLTSAGSALLLTGGTLVLVRRRLRLER